MPSSFSLRPRSIAALAAVSLLAAIIIRTVLVEKPIVGSPNHFDTPEIHEAAAIKRFSTALTFQTVSYTEKKSASEPFLAFGEYLRKSFPQVHKKLTYTRVNGYSHVYEWKGSSENLSPMLFIAHYDVVPVETETLPEWTYPPYQGQVADGYIWGRGALDDKMSVMALLEASEALLESRFHPKRSLYFAFGHDEEIGGAEGAAAVAKYFAEQNLRFEAVIDEGGAVIQGAIPGIDQATAMVGIAEKGFMSITLETRQAGGHSSVPPPQSAVGILSAAVTKLEKNPMAASFSEANERMLDYLTPHMPFFQRMALANRWLLRPIILSLAQQDPPGAASVRTTTAATVFHAGSKDNVLPVHAKATINFRLAPGDSIEDVLSHVKSTIDDERIEIQVLDHAREATPPSSTEGLAWERLSGTIQNFFPNSIVAPYLLVGGTDAQHYRNVADNGYRFLPLFLDMGEHERIHGIDERISTKTYLEAIRFYAALLQSMAED